MKSIIITLFVLCSLTLNAKPIRIVVSDLIGSAKYIGEVIIIKFDGQGKVYFKTTKQNDKIKSAYCGKKVNNGYNFPYRQEDNYWTENIPFIGDTVLIIIDANERIKVYGKKVNNDYRLWSPLMSGSIALFDFEKPLKPIEQSKLLQNSDTNKTMTSWDGCLLPIDKLNNLITEYKKRFSNKLKTVDITQFKAKPVYSVFYDETLNYYTKFIWSDEPPGKLYSLTLVYNNGKTLEIIPVVDKNHPRQFDENRNFDLEKFKLMTIEQIKWTN